MNLLELDHIVVGAATLEEGTAYVENALGVKLQQGGKHAFMGTHNNLLKLGNGVYLEVIAIDPSAPPPPRPRWFNLDNTKFQESLKGNPRIIHWVVRTRNIEQAILEIPGANQPIIQASRADLKWKITIPNDGTLPQDGAFPTIIEWPEGAHVSERMEDHGCELVGLVIEHPGAEQISQDLDKHIADSRLTFQTAKHPSLKATFRTPQVCHEL